MSVLSFLRYPLESVLRNKRRSLFAVIGIVLAISLIAGSSIAVDSSAYGLLRAAIGEVNVDLYANEATHAFIYDGPSYFEERTAAIERVADVEKALPFASINGWQILGNKTSYIDSSLVFLSHESDCMLEAWGITGEMPAQGKVAISRDTARDLGAEVGDEMTVSVVNSQGYYDYANNTLVHNTTWLNLTFEISSIWTQDPAEHKDYYWGPVGSLEADMVLIKYTVNPVVMNLDDMASVMEKCAGFQSSYFYPVYEYHIWVDRSEVINLANVGSSIEKLNYIRQRIDSAGVYYGFYVNENALVEPLYEFGAQLEAMKLLFLVLSLPVVALGTYLSVVGIDLGLNERRREIGILKSRGGSNKQVYWLLLLESIVLGAFAGVAGLGLGVIVSRFLLGAASTFGTDLSTSPEITDFRMNSNTVTLALLFGILLMFVSSYRPLKRLSRTQVSEALHHYSPASTQVGYKIRTDVILFSLAVLSIVSTLLGTEWASHQGGSWIFQLVLGLIILIGVVILPVMPFLLSLSVIRMVTRGSKRLYSKLTLIVRPWTKELHYLVDKNIVRNPRRASNLGVIISLALAFGLFISVTMESSMAYEREVVKYDVGSDARVDAETWSYWGETSEMLDLSFLGQLESVEGLESAASFIRCEMYSGGYYYGWHASAALIDPDKYLETVDPSDFYFEGSSRDLLALNTNGTVLVESSYADMYSIVKEDILYAVYSFNFYSYNSSYTKEWRFPLRVAGFVKGLPGLPGVNFFVDRSTLGFIPDSNFSSMSTVGAFIDVAGGASPRTVAEDAVDLFSANGLSQAYITVMEERLKELEDDPFFGPLADFLYMEYALSIVIMSVGVGLIIFVAVSDRQTELACIMARGSSSSQMRKMLMGESISLMVLGLIVGASVGLITAFIFNELTSLDVYAVVPRRMIFSFVSLAVVLVLIGSLLAASLIATARAGKIRLAEVLRIRGG